jgi:protein-disulfide isomerase
MRFLLFVCLLFPVAAWSQTAEEWQTATDLPGISMDGLTPAQKADVLELLRSQDCTCGCAMKMAECRVKDPACSYSKGLAQLIVNTFRAGKTREEVIAAMKASPLIHGPGNRPVLENPVLVPVAGAPSKGPEDARVVLIEFSDFECPYCRQAVGQVEALMKMFPHDIRLYYKQFPLSMHPHARLAAAAALAANAQGKFWEMHDQLFANSHDLTEAHIMALAKQLGLDMTRFAADLKSGKFDPAINKDMKDGENAGVEGTPAFFINGKLYNGPMDVSRVKPLIEAELRPVSASK